MNEHRERASARELRRVWEITTPAGTYLRAEGKLYQLPGNAHPHFSLVGEEWETKGHYQRAGSRERGLIAMGAMGDAIEELIPETAVLNALHLSDETGEPMHAVANGWYFYSGAAHEYKRNSPYSPEPTDTPHECAARTLRVSPEELPRGLDREGFEAFAETLRDRWQEEANRGKALLSDA